MGKDSFWKRLQTAQDWRVGGPEINAQQGKQRMSIQRCTRKIGIELCHKNKRASTSLWHLC